MVQFLFYSYNPSVPAAGQRRIIHEADVHVHVGVGDAGKATGGAVLPDVEIVVERGFVLIFRVPEIVRVDAAELVIQKGYVLVAVV